MDFTRTESTSTDFFFRYIFGLELPYKITDVDLKLKDGINYITILTDRELSLSEQSDLNQKIQEYSDFNQTVINEEILSKCKIFGRRIIDEFELKNMIRKDTGLMARQELDDIMEETHDKFIFICLLEGSLDSLHGKLYGYPEQEVNGVVWPARSPLTFDKIWQEDIDWIKSELNTFLASL